MKRQFSQTGKWLVAIILVISQFPALTAVVTAQQRAQTTVQLRTSFQRGYTSGYTDGFKEGKADFTAKVDRDFQASGLYQDATRGYQSRFGSEVDYEDGYRLGFEVGYLDGYIGRVSNSKLPANATQLARGVTARTETQPTRPRTRLSQSPVPNETSMRIRLETRLATKENSEGDKFTASVIEPSQYEGAMIQGHIAKLSRSGKMTGRTELALDFDSITLKNGRNGPFYAQIEKVFATESVKSVDEEGNVESASKTKDTEIRTIGGAVLGAIIGVIAGGGKGAAIGAIIGAGVGAGSVYVQGQKDLILEPGVQMMVRTTGPQERAVK